MSALSVLMGSTTSVHAASVVRPGLISSPVRRITQAVVEMNGPKNFLWSQFRCCSTGHKSETLRFGTCKISAIKVIENPDEIVAGEKAIEEFINRLDIRNLPADVRMRSLAAVQRYNVDSEEKGKETETGGEEGEREKAFDMAKNMLGDNMPIDIIEVYTGLTPQEIEALKANKK